jgi:FlaA1/EpsC-like NDP-sugar epimerase
MLRRDQQIRTQLLQLKDTALFALALFLGHFLRSSFPEEFWEFNSSRFSRSMTLSCSTSLSSLARRSCWNRWDSISAPSWRRGEGAWMLFKACFLTTVGLILFMFLFRHSLARGVIVMFGGISFALVFVSDELLRMAQLSRFGQSQPAGG